LIEAYEANWKFEIFKARARANASADADGFVKTQKQYVPKSAIISSEDSSKKTGGKKGRSRVNSSAKDEKVSYVYMPKNVQPSQEEAGNTLKPPSTKTKAKNSSSDNKFIICSEVSNPTLTVIAKTSKLRSTKAAKPPCIK